MSDVWVGLRRCGCCVAVVIDDPEHAADVESTKREFLRDGLSVVQASWADWQVKYLPLLKRHCEHIAEGAISAPPPEEPSR